MVTYERAGETKAVFLPQELYWKVEERVTATELGSVDEYVMFVLQKVLKDEEDEA